MSSQDKSKDILRQIAESMAAKEAEKASFGTDHDSQGDNSSGAENNNTAENEGSQEKGGSQSNDKKIHEDDHSGDVFTHDEDVLKELRRKKGHLNLAERQHLLGLLGRLFKIQLICMNIIVFIVIVWAVFDFPFFRELKGEVLSDVMSFMKFYISAVLVELLGGIIFITHKVFTQKLDDN